VGIYKSSGSRWIQHNVKREKATDNTNGQLRG
jgi:hypothetical protein